jgi:MFS family permease
LLILFVVLISAFVAVQIWKKDTATVPPHIIAHRSVFSGVWYSAFTGASLMLLVYYLPIWFQAIKDASAVHSGIMSLPLVMALVFSSIATGGMVTRFGYYTPFLISSSVLMSIGTGLLTTFTTSTGHSKWIGYQALCGFGIGMGMQQSSMAAQAVLAKKDVPTGVSLMMFAQSLGGALFVSIGQNVFTSRLISGLHDVADLDPQTIVNTGATALRHVVDPKLLPLVLEAYNGALVKVFYVAVATTCTSLLGGLGMEWINIKKVREQRDGPPSDASTAGAEAKEKEGDDKV